MARRSSRTPSRTSQSPIAEEEHEALHFLREQVAGLAHLHHLAPDRTAVPFAEVRAALAEAADRFEPDERTLTGRITVCDPLTLRYAPHRVVAFVGLNDGTFPRPHDEDPLDLVAVAPRAGDPRPRHTERQLFLDAVLAARDRLLLSFVGRSERDNGPRAASPVLEVVPPHVRRHVRDAGRAARYGAPHGTPSPAAV